MLCRVARHGSTSWQYELVTQTATKRCPRIHASPTSDVKTELPGKLNTDGGGCSMHFDFQLTYWILFCCDQKAMLLIRNWVSQPLLLYTIYWSLMLAATVTVAALSLEMGFSTAISAEACTSPSSSSCRQCFRLPLDGSRDAFCVPAEWFKNTGMDFAVPPIFAALVVTASALFVQSLGLWSF